MVDPSRSPEDSRDDDRASVVETAQRQPARAALLAAPGLWIGLAAIALGLVMIVQAWGRPFLVLGRGTGPMAFPLIVGYLEVFLGLVLLIRTVAGWDGRVPAAWPSGIDRRHVLTFALLAVLYVLILDRAGFLLANLVVGLASLRLLGGYSWLQTILLAAVLSVGLSLIFEVALRVSLPGGPLPWP
jgi:putative tricarboxylic transport membrane protein